MFYFYRVIKISWIWRKSSVFIDFCKFFLISIEFRLIFMENCVFHHQKNLFLGKLCFNVLVVAAMCWKIAWSFVTRQGTFHTKILTIVKEHNFCFIFTESLKYHEFEENFQFSLIFVHFWWFSLNFAWFQWKIVCFTTKKFIWWKIMF